jgi:hypothetical protein
MGSGVKRAETATSMGSQRPEDGHSRITGGERIRRRSDSAAENSRLPGARGWKQPLLGNVTRTVS